MRNELIVSDYEWTADRELWSYTTCSALASGWQVWGVRRETGKE